MGFIGNVIDYATPIGWAGKAAQAAGVTDQSVGEYAESVPGSIDEGRRQQAQYAYGMIDPQAGRVAGANALRQGFQQYGQQFGQQYNPLGGEAQAQRARLLAMAQGKGPSLAAQQAQSSAQQAIAGQQAAAAGARPGMAALQARTAAQQAGAAQGSIGGQAAMGRAQEQMSAMGQLGNMINQGQNVGMRGRQLAQEAALQGMRGQMSVSELIQKGSLGRERLRAQLAAAAMGQPSGAEAILSAGTSALGTAAGMV